MNVPSNKEIIITRLLSFYTSLSNLLLEFLAFVSHLVYKVLRFYIMLQLELFSSSTALICFSFFKLCF